MSGKIPMTYELFKEICIQIADRYSDVDEIVAVTRGGLTASHIIAKRLKKQVGFFFPSKQLYVPYGNPKKVLIVEDLIATGRTYEIIKESFPKEIEYYFVPILMDASYENTYKLDYGIKSSDWVVFPYEDIEMVTEGDRGLFRDGSGLY